MTFGDDWGWGASRSESAKQFELFADAGGTLIDTANKYTNATAESILGELLAALTLLILWLITGSLTLPVMAASRSLTSSHPRDAGNRRCQSWLR
jgi:hypothetical protein